MLANKGEGDNTRSPGVNREAYMTRRITEVKATLINVLVTGDEILLSSNIDFTAIKAISLSKAGDSKERNNSLSGMHFAKLG